MKVLIVILFVALTACKGESSAPKDNDHQPLQPAKESIHIVIPYGQSNAAGSARDIEGAPDVPQGWAYEWRGHKGEAVHLEEPTRQDSYIRGSSWSAFAIRFHELTGEKVVVVNSALGGRKVSELLPSSKGGMIAFDWMRDAIHYYSNSEYEIKSVSMVWLQGETDARDLTPIDDYFSDLELVKAEFLSVHKNAIFYTARVGYNSNHNRDQVNHSFDLGFEQIARSRYPVYAKTPSFHEKGLMSEDGVHYTQKAYNQMGSDIADNIYSYLNGIDISCRMKEESFAMQNYNPYSLELK